MMGETTYRSKGSELNSELGKRSEYDPHYNPDKLFPIPRQLKRDEMGISPEKLPFYGFDLWNHYEVSWLNNKGKPIVALAEIVIPCESPYLIESKSMKLYFNSLNNTQFADSQSVQERVAADLSARAGAPIDVKIIPLRDVTEEKLYGGFEGLCLDDLDIECSVYTVCDSYLTVSDHYVEETVYSDLLKSNCLVTLQPDWGSILISYKGQRISHEGLLRYITSFRNHNEFGEQCIERIFTDIMAACKPKELTVYGRYTRRGGLDINPYRSTNKQPTLLSNQRLCRQ